MLLYCSNIFFEDSTITEYPFYDLHSFSLLSIYSAEWCAVKWCELINYTVYNNMVCIFLSWTRLC